jgi:hypothetical protein
MAALTVVLPTVVPMLAPTAVLTPALTAAPRALETPGPVAQRVCTTVAPTAVLMAAQGGCDR